MKNEGAGKKAVKKKLKNNRLVRILMIDKPKQLKNYIWKKLV